MKRQGPSNKTRPIYRDIPRVSRLFFVPETRTHFDLNFLKDIFDTFHFLSSVNVCTHFQVTLSVFYATDCFMWGCPQNHQATIQGRQRQKASQTP